jgi:primosomal protein N' (replication factor Y)
MTHRVEVFLPGPWWNTLTYILDGPRRPPEGARVRVPVGNGKRVGFVAARRIGEPTDREIKPIAEILDESSALGDELWGLADWLGRTFLCGMGEALQLICPALLLRGEALPPRPPSEPPRPQKSFQEFSFYHPLCEARFAYYRERLEGRVLLLFSEKKTAEAFFTELPAAVKANALLWPSSGGKKLWEAWKKTASGGVQVVVGPAGAVFAPFAFDEVIVDDESNPAYVFQKSPRISARSLAGRRALALGARLVFGGWMPSAKTYLRSRPKCPHPLPPRGSFVLVNLKRTLKVETRGVEGKPPITASLVDRTRAVLDEGRHVLWFLDRKGQAGEVYCADCGGSFSCLRCGGVMRVEGDGEGTALRCIRCGLRGTLPLQCPTCQGTLLLGKRPGLEALFSLASWFFAGRAMLFAAGEKPAVPSVILGTRRLLPLCDMLDVGLAAWLDLDAEARKVEYSARFLAFSMVWESYWRGLNSKGRTVLVQTRRPGMVWQNAFRLGWAHFWKAELRERESLGLPPYGLLVQIDPPGKTPERDALIRLLERAGIFVMDAGEGPLWVAGKSTERLAAALAPRFEIKHSRRGFPVVTVWAE